MSTSCPKTNLILEALPSEFPLSLVQHIISPYLIPPTPEEVFLQVLSKYQNINYFFHKIGEKIETPSKQLLIIQHSNLIKESVYLKLIFHYKKPQPLAGYSRVLTNTYQLYFKLSKYEWLFK